MKELKGVDENTCVQLSSEEEVKKCKEICEAAGYHCEFSYGEYLYVYPETRDACRRMYIHDYKAITAAEFIRLNTKSEIPNNWCVRRTPENAEILNAWGKSKSVDWEIYTSEFLESTYGYVTSEGYGFIFIASAEYPEITFSQWQTIPEVKEWFKTYNMSTRGAILKGVISTDKVEEREIIGRVVPMDLYAGAVKDGDIVTKSKHWNAYETAGMGINPKYYFPCEIAESWPPYYKIKKPVFKVGDWVTVKRGNLDSGRTLIIEEIAKDSVCRLSNQVWYNQIDLNHATPEEIEAARPKRKYMQQVWYVLVMDKSLQPIATSEAFYSEPEANEWVLRVSEEGRVYSVKPFEVVAYE